MIAPWLETGEVVVAEHHWIDPYDRMPTAPLKEVAQVAGSMYATDRRVFRWRFQDRAAPHAAGIDGFEEGLEVVRYEEVAGLVRRRTTRWGEAGVGCAIGLVGWGLRPHLSITGPALIVIGLFGLIHGLAVPTRCIVLTRRDPAEPDWPIWASRTASGRRLLAHIRCCLSRHVATPSFDADLRA